jgi:hypothetical protein
MENVRNFKIKLENITTHKMRWTDHIDRGREPNIA